MTSVPEQIEKTTDTVVSYVTDVADTIRDDAIERASQKVSAFQQNMTLAELLEQAGFVDYFKYELARGVANALAANDQRVQGVYVYDPSANPGGEPDSTLALDMTVHLIVKVTLSSLALEGFIDSLDEALVRSLAELPSPLLDQRTYLLDAVIVTEEEVTYRSGYGVLLTSMFAPALKIWERGE